VVIWDEVQAERERAHAKHGETSMETLPVTDMTRLSVLVEEVGEVAREFNDARHLPDPFGPDRRAALRTELIQVAAMAGAWADALTDVHEPITDDGVTYCGWDGHRGCGEVWPCSTVRARGQS
jgi:NTP pyrophosphatase (non-canonical NTP hydrolase)